jgi:hypothetical protein
VSAASLSEREAQAASAVRAMVAEIDLARITGIYSRGCVWRESTPVCRLCQAPGVPVVSSYSQLKNSLLETQNSFRVPVLDLTTSGDERETRSSLAGYTSRDAWSAIELSGSPAPIGLGAAVNGLPCKSSESAVLSLSVVSRSRVRDQARLLAPPAIVLREVTKVTVLPSSTDRSASRRR